MFSIRRVTQSDIKQQFKSDYIVESEYGHCYISSSIYFNQPIPHTLQWFYDTFITPTGIDIYYIHDVWIYSEYRHKGHCTDMIRFVCDQFKHSFLSLHVRIPTHETTVPFCYLQNDFIKINDLTFQESKHHRLEYYIHFPDKMN